MPRRASRSHFQDTSKPRGSLATRVEAVGPIHFGIVAIDVGKRASRVALFNYYGTGLVAPFDVFHNRSAIQQMVSQLNDAKKRHQIKDLVVAIESTGSYHRAIVQELRRRNIGWEIREVHPHASNHFRKTADLGEKTDDKDLAGIFRAACQGFGLCPIIWPEVYEHLRTARRHRRDLVLKRSRLQRQIREELHLLLPGFAEQFHNLWESDVPLALARHFGSPERIITAGVDGLRQWAKQQNRRMMDLSFHKICQWAQNAPAADPFTIMRRKRLESLDDDRLQKTREIAAIELQMSELVTTTPYIRLLIIPGINVVTAADVAGELGPMYLYPNPNAITGRAGLMPSRYQSARVDHPNGPLVPRGNRRLRGALVLMGRNLVQSNNYFRARAAHYEMRGKEAYFQQVIKVVKTATRIAYHLVMNPSLYIHPCMQSDCYVMTKLSRFLLEYHASPEQTRTTLSHALEHLNAQWAEREEKPLTEVVDELSRARKGGIQTIGATITDILTRLKLIQSQTGGTPPA